MRRINFPVFTGGTISAHGYCHTMGIHEPVRVGGVMIYPDDLLHADVNGVTTIPKAIAAEVAEVGDAYVAAEMVIINTLKERGADHQRLKEARKESKRQMEVLRERVGRKA